MDLKDKIKNLRASLGLNQAQFARRLGETDQSLISKWENGKQTPNAERNAKLAELAGQSIGEWMGLRPLARREVSGRTIRVVGDLQAGAWREAIEWDYDAQFEVPAYMTPDMPPYAMKGFVVRGPSMNRIYPDGTVVFVASTIDNGIKLKHGQRVLVQRRNRDGLYEATLKELAVEDDGTKWLWPRSTDPEHQAPIQYRSSDTEEVTVTGVVMASFIMEAVR